MSTESDLRSAFLANGTVSGLISTRFYPLALPLDVARPAVVYQQTDGANEVTLGGAIISGTINYQLVLHAETYGGIVQLAAACRLLNGTTYGTIDRMTISDGADDYDFETNLYLRVMDVTCEL